jgi:DNA invertase Pin-like site-specific DNA recombinase
MGIERLTLAVGYVRVAMVDEGRGGAQVQRHKDTVLNYCRHSCIKLSHMMIDIGGRQERGRALDLLMMERAAVLVVPSLSQLTRNTGELAQMLDHYFSRPSGIADLIAVAEGIDTRTQGGRIAIDLLRSVARLESEGFFHA